MKTLESCYEIDFSKINFLERKIRITEPKTIVYGPPMCGKSFLIYDYLSTFEKKKYLYIDLNDYRNDIDEIKTQIQNFIVEKKVEVLAIENYDFEFELPNCDSIILSTSKNFYIDGFENLLVLGLDFEEYLLHDTKHQNLTASFNYFLKYGNLPEIIIYDENKKIVRLQELIKLNSKDYTEVEILKLLLTSIDEKKSINQLFTILKKRIKISKDRFYEVCKIYEENKTIFFLKKYNQEKSTKKLYVYNHAFLNALSHTKKFKNEFSNMIFLELHKRYKDIYFLDRVDFYIPNEKLMIVANPFFNTMLGKAILKKLQTITEEYEVSQLYIITVGNSERIIHRGCQINIIPFYEWALQ